MFGFTKSILTVTSLFALASQPAFYGHALAQEHTTVRPSEEQSAQIDISHINLDSDRNWNRVADAIHDKAADLCERNTPASDRRDADIEECTQTAYENGVQQMRQIYARRMMVSQTRLAHS